MKKTWILLTAILCLLFAAAAADESTDALTKEPWTNGKGVSFVVNADGTVNYDAGTLQLEGTWTFTDPEFIFQYELYGARELALTLGKDGDNWQLTNADGALFLPESVYAEMMASAGDSVSGYALPLGEEVTLPFISFKLEKVQLVDTIGGDKGYYPAAEGTCFFNLKGTVSNLSGGTLSMSNMSVQATFNDAYTYSGDVRVYSATGVSYSLDAMTKGELNIYVNIPNEMAEQITTARVVFAFNDDFGKRARTVAEGTYIFQVDVEGDALPAAQDGPVYARKTYQECPVLPAPDSFEGVFQSGSNTSSMNGKVTKIVYSYSFRGNKYSASDLMTMYVEKLEEEGFTVQKGSKETTVSVGKKKVATLTVDNKNLKVDIVPGNEKLDSMAQGASAASAQEEPKIKLGKTITANTAKVTLEKASTTKKIFSNKTGKGSYHYYESESGDTFYSVSGTFENTGKTPVDVMNIYAAVIIDGEYEYRANVIGVGKNASDFIRDVSPKKKTEIVVYASIPESALKSAKTIDIKLGFTDNFDTKVTTTGSLPIFDYCDQVFTYKAK